MDNKLSNEEIQKVFAMYYFAECTTVQHPPFEKGTVNTIGAIPTDVEYYKLLLTPLSDISDEDAIEIYDKFFLTSGTATTKEKKLTLKMQFEISMAWEIRDYLIQCGYAVPIFFSTNHWANGKTAIELSIAIQKTL